MRAHLLVRLAFLILVAVAMTAALVDLAAGRRPVLLGGVATRG
jgi:hypothetical protein